MAFGRKKKSEEDPGSPLYEMQNFTRREITVNPYRHMIMTHLAIGTALGGNPLEFLYLALKGHPVPLEVPLETVNAVMERSQGHSHSTAECLDDLGIMRPFEIKVLREAEKMDTAVNARIHTDRAIRLITKYHQWSSYNITCTELAHLFCRMGLLSVFFPEPLLSDAIRGDPFLIKHFGQSLGETELPFIEELKKLKLSEFYLASLTIAEEKGKLPKAFELLADMEQE